MKKLFVSAAILATAAIGVPSVAASSASADPSPGQSNPGPNLKQIHNFIPGVKLSDSTQHFGRIGWERSKHRAQVPDV